MELYFTRHARSRMRLYEISLEQAQATVTNPEQITAGEFGRQHAWKRTAQGQWLRVTFKDEWNRRIIITVTPKRMFQEEIHEN